MQIKQTIEHIKAGTGTIIGNGPVATAILYLAEKVDQLRAEVGAHLKNQTTYLQRIEQQLSKR